MSTDPHWSDLRLRLQALMREVSEEIGTYPRPIAACDAQFNHLLDLRRRLPEELARLEAAAGDPSTSVEAFVRSSPCREELLASLESRGLTQRA